MSSRLSLARPITRLVLGASLALLPLVSAWNLMVPNRQIQVGPTLGGVTNEMPVTFSWSSIHDGSFQKAVANADGIRPREEGVPLDDLHVATSHRPSKVRRDILDQVLLALDQSRPVKLRFCHRDMMSGRALDLMQSVPGSNQHLLRRAAAVGTGAAEVARLHQRNRQVRLARRQRRADAGIAAADDEDVEFFDGHSVAPWSC